MEELLLYLDGIQKLSAIEKELVKGISNEMFITRNQVLQPVGHTCRTIYFVKKGMLRICYFKDGTDITESFEPENSIVARAESLFEGVPSKKAIQAVEDTELIAINAVSLFSLFNEHHMLERLFRKVFEQQYVRMIHRLEGLQFNSPEERYRQLMEEQPNIILRVPLKYIAGYLGITQVSLSRIRGRK